MTYVKKSAEERKQHGPRWRGEAGEWVGTHWFPVLPLIAEGRRRMPETRPDEEIMDHAIGCLCPVCARPEAIALRQRRLAQMRRVRS